MTQADTTEDTKAQELPKQLGRVKPRWVEKTSDTDTKTKLLVGTDTVTGREVDVARVAFGLERITERDAFVDAMKARTAITSPSLIAVHDAGEWDVDAFVATERIEGLAPIDVKLTELSGPERFHVARGLVRAVMAMDAAGLACTKPMIDGAEVDPYRQVRVRGLVEAREGTHDEGCVSALRDACARLAVGDDEALWALRASFETVAELSKRLEARAPQEAESPLLRVALSPAESRSVQTRALAIGLVLFLIAFAVLAAVLLSR